MNRIKPLVPAVVISAVVGAAIALIVSGGSSSTHTTTTVYAPSGASGSATGVPTAFSNSSRSMSINEIYRQDSPGVVDIKVVSTTSGPFGSQEEEGEGAGVVYDKQGDILTDEHVVANAQAVQVDFQDGTRATAKVLGTDPSTDVAVIKVNVPAAQLHPIAFTDSSAAQVGDPVIAIGSPFQLPETTTQGIVSAVGRPITAPNRYTITGAIQTDAAINPGNSGGPLLDASGKVLGLVDQILTENQTVGGQGSSSGIGFATPGNEDIRIANAIIAGHPIQHPFVGVELNQGSIGGAQISTVEPGTPGQSAGLQQYDLITAINGQKIDSTEAFIATVDNFKPGQTIALTVKRGGRSIVRHVTLGKRPASSPSAG